MLLIFVISLLAVVSAKNGKTRGSDAKVVITTFPDENDIDFYKTTVPPLPKLEKVLSSISPEKILNKKKMGTSSQKVSKKQHLDSEALKSKSQKNRRNDHFELVEADDDPELIIEADDVFLVPEAKIVDSSCSSCCKEDIKVQLAAEALSHSKSNTGKAQSIDRPDLKPNSSTSNIVSNGTVMIVILIISTATLLY